MKVKIATFLFLCLSLFANAQSESPLETVLQKGHSDYVKAFCFSPDGQYLVTGAFDNVLLLWEVQSGKQIRTYTGHTARVQTVRFSKNQKEILSLSSDNTVRVFDVLTGAQNLTLSIADKKLTNVYYSPNEKYIYAFGQFSRVYVWDSKTGKRAGTFLKDAGYYDFALIQQDDQKILSVLNATSFAVISIQNKDTLLSIPFDKVYSMSYSANGKYIGVSSRKLFANVYDAESGKLLQTFEDGDKKCDGCNTKHVFSPDSKYLLTMSGKVGAILWDVSSGKKMREFITPENKDPRQVSFSAFGNYVLIAFSKEIFVFDTKSGRQKIHVESDKIDYLEFQMSPDEKYLALPNDNGGTDLWGLNSGRLTKTIKGYLNSKDGNGWGLSYSNWRQQHVLSYIQHKRKVLLSPDNKHVLIGGVDSLAMLINIEDGRIVKKFEGHAKTVIAFDFSPDGKQVATAGVDALIHIWEVSSGNLLKTLKGHTETVFDLKYNANGDRLVSSAWDRLILEWDLESGESESVWLENGSAYNVGFSPNELYLVLTDLEKNVVFWERDAVAPFRSLVGHTGIVSEFDFSPDKKHMVTASWDGTVKVWDVLTGMLIAKMSEHQGQVYAAQYDPNNRFIASAGADNAIILWDPNSNEIINRLVGHSNAVTSIDISTDGKRLISMSIDGLMKVWDLDSYALIYSRIQMSATDWLATNSSGYFDGTSKAINWVNYVKGNQVVNVGKLFEKYYAPNLIQRIHLEDQKLEDRSETIGKEMEELPKLTLSLNQVGKRSLLSNSDSIFEVTSQKVPIEVFIGKHDTPLEEIRLYNNGKLILQESLEENISFRGIGDRVHSFEVELANGVNEITALIVNEQRTESEPSKAFVVFNGEKAKTDLFVLSVGINKYKNETYNLDYAVNDAKSFLKTIKSGADSLFNEVFTYSVLNAEANKNGIMEAIEAIKKQIGKEDVFLFYYAGHGVMSNESVGEDSEFFIVTHDVTNLYDSPKVIREKAISATELMQFSIDIAAEKQLFILDACHSGGAIESFAVRGSEREKALAQLARNTGTFFLTAAQDAEYANEVGKLNHGLFTYALIEILEGAVSGDGDQKVTVNEIKSYVEERVPELTKEYHGSPQYPTGYSFGRDFPIVIVK